MKNSQVIHRLTIHPGLVQTILIFKCCPKFQNFMTDDDINLTWPGLEHWLKPGLQVVKEITKYSIHIDDLYMINVHC